MKSDLFGEKTIKDFISSINLTLKQKTSANAWIELLEKGELEEEVANYPRFMIHILQNILGYDITSFNHEEGNMEFAFKDDSGEFLVCFEAKGAKTEDLWKSQGRNVKVRETPVNQINDYLYKNKIPFGVLTNYREFVLFKREEGYTKFHKFNFLDIKGHPDKLKEFIAIFSRNSFEKKETEKLYEKSLIEEREFTKEFYKLYHETRLMLIREFEENTEISKEDSVHFAQIFLNRLMFVFFAEDTGKIENRTIEERLLKTLESKHLFSSNSNNISNALVGLFRDLDKGSDFPTKLFGFNGGLFKHPIPEKVHFKDFRDSVFFKEIYQNSKLKNKTLNLNENEKKIFNEYKDKISPVIRNILLMGSFDFKSEVNVNILGHIFEQSISDIEDLKADQTSKRKKDGIFYTPEYITDYICRNTIIPYLSKEGNAQTVSDLIKEYSEGIEELENKFKEMKILDPACGSGAFLIKATDIMLEVFKAIQEFKQSEGEYKAFKHGAGRLGKKKLSGSEGQLNLFKWDEESEAREIIENNIYGVDINEESVEITKLSLFLKMARKNRKLTDLSKNIKQGNSLIDDESIAGKLAFDWNKEFKEIIDKGGFDIVVGNPPYVRQELFSDIKTSLKDNYQSYNSLADLYVYFIERGILLNREGGSFSFIVPNKFLRATYGKQIRNFIKSNVSIRKIYNFNDYPVFEEATTYPIIFVFDKKKKEKSFIYSDIDARINSLDPLSSLNGRQSPVSYNSLTADQWSFVDEGVGKILEKMGKDSITLKELSNNRIFRGISTGKNDVFIINENTKNKILDDKNADYIRKIITGKEVKKYSLSFDNKYLLFIPWDYELGFSKKISDYLESHKSELEERPEVKEGRFNWWCLSRYGSNNSEWLFEPKIIYPRINKKCNFYLDQTGEMSLSDNNFFISSNSLDLLAILNSNLIFFYLKQICSTLQGGYLDFRRPYIETIPIKNNHHDLNLSEKADLMLDLNKDLYEKKEKFLKLLKQEYSLEKLSTKLNRFYDLSFDEFMKQLKVKLSIEKKSGILDFFEKTKKEVSEISDNIKKTDKEINEMVYKLYRITDEEKKIVESSL